MLRKLFFLLIIVGFSQAINVDNCGTLSTANGAYALTTSPAINSSTCFTVSAQNITLNCAGYTITGSNTSSTYGVYSSQFNTTIQNCKINSFQYQIYFNKATNGTIQNNSITANYAGGRGMYILTSNYTKVFNNTINASGNLTYAFNFQTSANFNLFANNTIFIESSINNIIGIWVGNGCLNNTIQNNTVSGGNGTLLDYPTVGINNLCNYNVFEGNNITSSAAYPVSISTNTAAYNTTFANNTITAIGTGICIPVVGTSAILYNNTINANGTAINITAPNITIDCAGARMYGNNSSSTYGVYSNQTNTTVKNCIINNYSTGVYFSGGTSGLIQNNTINNTLAGSGSSGIRADTNNARILFNNVSSDYYTIRTASDFLVIANNTATALTYGSLALSGGSANALVENNTFTTKNVMIDLYMGINHFVQKNTFIGTRSGGTGIYVRGATVLNGATNNSFINNTINMSLGTAFYFDSNATSSYVYYNNITGTIWSNSLNSTNYFNTTGAGNIYYFANGTPSWNVFNITTTGVNWADGGADWPFNATTVGGNWSGLGQDWHPWLVPYVGLVCEFQPPITSFVFHPEFGTGVSAMLVYPVNQTSPNGTYRCINNGSGPGTFSARLNDTLTNVSMVASCDYFSTTKIVLGATDQSLCSVAAWQQKNISFYRNYTNISTTEHKSIKLLLNIS